MPLSEKINHLAEILQGYGPLAIAFSGGVDSGLLVKCALDTVGAGNVLVFFARSVLMHEQRRACAEQWMLINGYPESVELTIFDVQPLLWKEFTANSPDRCYLCKMRLYSLFREHAERCGVKVLADGTHTDDLKQRRSGLRAIHALDVKMPLVEAGFSRNDVVQCSEFLGVQGCGVGFPEGCLAERIPSGVVITPELVEKIKSFDNMLLRFGVTGACVQLADFSGNTVVISLPEDAFTVFENSGNRQALVRFFRNNGIDRVYLDLSGR